MKAIVYHRFGEVEELEMGEMPKPKPKSDEVLVHVHAAALNPIDCELRKGVFKALMKGSFPRIPGSDFSGTVIKKGKNCAAFAIGDEVFGMTKTRAGGSYAEYVAISHKEIAIKPKNMTHQEAASFPLAALTVLQALRNHGKLQPRQSLLINGASGGVGVYALQIARIMGAKITAVCSYRNVDRMKELGANEVIDYTETNVRELGKKFDVIFDVYGNQSFPRIRHLLQPRGRHITTIPSPKNFRRQFLSIFSSQTAKVVMVKSLTSDLNLLREWIEDNKLRPVIDRVYSLAEARDAQAYLETRRAKGKILLEVLGD